MLVLAEAMKLSRDDQLQLIEAMEGNLGAMPADRDDAPRFEDYAGSAPYPLCGEDAQEWVTRTRRESDEARARALGPRPSTLDP